VVSRLAGVGSWTLSNLLYTRSNRCANHCWSSDQRYKPSQVARRRSSRALLLSCLDFRARAFTMCGIVDFSRRPDWIRSSRTLFALDVFSRFSHAKSVVLLAPSRSQPFCWLVWLTHTRFSRQVDRRRAALRTNTSESSPRISASHLTSSASYLRHLPHLRTRPDLHSVPHLSTCSAVHSFSAVPMRNLCFTTLRDQRCWHRVSSSCDAEPKVKIVKVCSVCGARDGKTGLMTGEPFFS